ncbi:MAG: hypothetical protein LAQ30_01335 [Acidobacteriia bacterium]|nr:hypothetical protein [Terriglobia bacterium]
MFAPWRYALALALAAVALYAQWRTAPAGIRPAFIKAGGSILPGGRIVAPAGDQYITGAGPFGLALSASGKAAVTANGGPGVNSLTALARNVSGGWDARQILARSTDVSELASASDWRGVSLGVALSGDHAAFVSEGNSGRISFLDWNSDRRRIIDLNQDGYADSYTGDLAFDPESALLYAADQANFRVAVIEARSRQVIASVKTGRLPFALALSPDRRTLYVTNAGMFQYQPIPGADPKNARATGLPFPAFGFPSAEAVAGGERMTARGPVQVPGLGDPNAPEGNSLAIVDVSDPSAPKLEALLPTGTPFGDEADGGSSPSGVTAAAGRVFVSNANSDSITVIDAGAKRVEAEIPIRVPGLETLRGVLPVGMAYHEASGWLLVAEAGINAVGVIDVRRRTVLGHVPAGWFPTRVALAGNTVFVTNARGVGSGRNDWAEWRLPGQSRPGSLSVFPLPKPEELAPAGGAPAARGRPAGGPYRQGEPHVRRGFRRHPGSLQRARHVAAGTGPVGNPRLRRWPAQAVEHQRYQCDPQPPRDGPPVELQR